MADEMHFAHRGCDQQPPLRYRACGLDNVYLTSGYTREEIGGVMYTSVQDADELHKAIAMHLVLRRKVLRGQEVRFLRKLLDCTQAELGQLFGVSDQTIARYEKGQSEFDGPADTLLRLLVAGKVLGLVDPHEEIQRIRQSDSVSSDNLVLEHEGSEWKIAA